MKKIMVALLAIALVLTMTAPVFAAGNFVSSPSAQDTPVLDKYSFNGDCTGALILTPYSQRDTLDKDAKDLLEDCYQQIKDSKDLTKLFPDVKVPDGKKLLVGDLFNVDYDDCADHNAHNPFTVTVKPSTVKNFVAVVAYVDGKWVSVDAKLDGDKLIITSGYYGPYAIVLADEAAPGTGDDFPWGYLIAMVVSAAGLVVIGFSFKKKVA